HGDHVGPRLDDFFDFQADLAEVDVEVLQDVGGDAGPLLDEAEEDVLGADVLVVEALRLLVGQLHHLTGPVGESLIHSCHLRQTPPRLRSPWAAPGWGEPRCSYLASGGRVHPPRGPGVSRGRLAGAFRVGQTSASGSVQVLNPFVKSGLRVRGLSSGCGCKDVRVVSTRLSAERRRGEVRTSTTPLDCSKPPPTNQGNRRGSGNWANGPAPRTDGRPFRGQKCPVLSGSGEYSAAVDQAQVTQNKRVAHR